MNDVAYMKLALSLAKATIGQTSPNPSVGSVIVKDGRLVGTGTHLKAGGAHAEVIAIKEAKEQTNDAVLYVTLEPCNHYGKTPPCTDLIIQSGIKKVYVATLDPNPLVRGKGVEKLLEAGIDVEVGLCEEEALPLYEKFFHFIQTNTPYVTLKTAISFDGKTATKTGDSKWITSKEARRDVHHLRHEHDAILVGIGTVLKDNPLLTTRRPQGGINPIRVILDTNLKIPYTANVVQDRSAKTIIFTGNSIDVTKKEKLEQQGVEIISLMMPTISIKEVLRMLGERKVTSLLVEGGATVHASFLKENAFQQIVTYIAPTIIGGNLAKPFIGGDGALFVKDGKRLQFTSVERIGPDIKIIAKPLREEDSRHVHRNCGRVRKG